MCSRMVCEFWNVNSCFSSRPALVFCEDLSCLDVRTGWQYSGWWAGGSAEVILSLCLALVWPHCEWGEGTGASLLGGKAGSWACWTWRREGWEGISYILYINILKEAVRQRDQTLRSNRHKLNHRKLHLDMRKNCGGDRALEQVVQRGCRVSFPGYIQNLPGCDPVQCAPGDPAWPGCWTLRTSTILWFPVLFWAPQHKKRVRVLGSVQRRATKQVKGLEGMSCGGRLRMPGLSHLESRRPRGGLASLCSAAPWAGEVGVEVPVSALWSLMTGHRGMGQSCDGEVQTGH